MATVQGAHSSYSEPTVTGGNREDLSDVLKDLSPTEVPFYSACGSSKATATNYEWLTDTLEEPAFNANIEGQDANPAPAASRIRMGNYTQSLKKNAVVTHTQERVLKGGGIKGEMAYQVGRRMKAMKRDAEHILVGVHNAKVAGSTSVAREMGSFSSYLGDENGDIDLPGSSIADAGDGTRPGGDGSSAFVPGTARALTENIFKDALSQLWVQSGGNENIIAVCGAKQRGIISEFAGSATRYVTTDDARLQASIDVYDGDFHTVTVVPDRFCLVDSLFLVDSEYVNIADLDPMNSYDLGKTGDSYKKEIRWEFTLEVTNPRAHVHIADLL